MNPDDDREEPLLLLHNLAMDELLLFVVCCSFFIFDCLHFLTGYGVHEIVLHRKDDLINFCPIIREHVESLCFKGKQRTVRPVIVLDEVSHS